MPEPGERTEPDLEILRVSLRDEGAFGVILARQVPLGRPGVPIAVSLERTYPLPDAPHSQLLKIPAGRHRCVRSYYYKGRVETFEVLVLGHDRLLFHVANVEPELDGCIAVGRRFGMVFGKPGILESREGFRDFMAWAGRRQAFDLEVRNAA